MPVLLFAIIFFWTPPHFWALALFVKTDYAKVGIPMMPVVAGHNSTRRQILIYAVLLTGASYLIGQLIPLMGISWGITWVAIGPIIGAILVMKYAPETRGLTLEQIQEKLGGDAKRGAQRAAA